LLLLVSFPYLIAVLAYKSFPLLASLNSLH
jgi:hypothetical protein